MSRSSIDQILLRSVVEAPFDPRWLKSWRRGRLTDRLLRAAVNNGVLAILNEWVKTHVASETPADLLHGLEYYARGFAIQRCQLTHEWEGLAACAQERDLAVLPFKGLVLGEEIYPRPELRPITDLDLLIKREQLPEWSETLRTRGYEMVRPGAELRHRAWFGEIAWVRRDAVPVMVELHWDVVNSPALREDRGPILRSLFRRPGRLSLDPLDHLIILSLHAVRAHQLDRLIQLVDADRWWRKYGRAYPLETILRRSNQWRAESEMWTLLTLAKRLLATAVPESLLEEIYPRRVWNRLGIGFLGKATILNAHGALSQWRRKVARQLLKPGRPVSRRRLDHSESPLVDTFRLGHWDVAALPGLHRNFVLRVLGDVERGVVPSQLVKPGMRRTLSRGSADLQGSTVEVAIKQYRASGYRRLLGLRRPLGKARRNLSVTTWLAAVGVVCPCPLLLAASRQCKTVVYVTEWLSDYEMIRRRIPALARAPEAGEERKALCSALGRFLRNLHELGLDHPDLSEHNILVRGEGSDMAFAVLDLEDAVVRARPVRSRVGRRLSRLSRFTKEYLHRTERLRGLCAYFECSRLTSKKKRKAAVKLEARAQSELEQRQRRIDKVLTKLAQQLH